MSQPTITCLSSSCWMNTGHNHIKINKSNLISTYNCITVCVFLSSTIKSFGLFFLTWIEGLNDSEVPTGCPLGFNLLELLCYSFASCYFLCKNCKCTRCNGSWTELKSKCLTHCAQMSSGFH